MPVLISSFTNQIQITMGKSAQGVFGDWNGKVGHVVGKVLQGRNIYSIYQPNVANPKTPAQMAWRSRFSLLSSVLSKMTGALKVGYMNLDGYSFGSGYSSAVGFNLKHDAIQESGGSISVNWSKLMVAYGSVDLPYSPQGNCESNTLSVSWADNTGRGNALATDQAALVVYNKSKNTCVYTTSVATRSERAATLSLPSEWGGDDVEAYLFMTRPNVDSSKSYYLGSFTL